MSVKFYEFSTGVSCQDLVFKPQPMRHMGRWGQEREKNWQIMFTPTLLLPASPSPPSLSHRPLELRKTLAIYDVMPSGPSDLFDYCAAVRLIWRDCRPVRMRSDRVDACAGRIPSARNEHRRDVKVSEQVSELVSELERTSDSFSILAGFTIFTNDVSVSDG